MSDQDLNSKFTDLIPRYLSGEATDAEVRELEKWVSSSEENKRLFIALKKTWMLSGMAQNTVKVDVNQQWAQTSGQLFGKARVVDLHQRRDRRKWWIGVAAAIFLLAVAGLWVILHTGGEKEMIVRAEDTIHSFDLPDGSRLTLNQNSSAHYIPDQAEGRRRVRLEGDAFFEVAREEARPFVINAGEVEVEVLGTSFYVDARQLEPAIEVVVKSGSVAVRTTTGSAVLAPEEKAVFRKADQQLVKQQNEDLNFASIKTDTLKFENTPLEEVAVALNRHYSVEVTINGEVIKECELNATYVDKPLDTVLELIENTLVGVTAERQGTRIILSGENCE